MNDATTRLPRTALVVFLLVTTIAAMKFTMVVTMPVALALMVVILAWPLQRVLERRGIRRWICYILTLLAILIVFLLFVGLLWICVQSVAAKAPEYEGRFATLYQQAKEWLDWDGENNQNGRNGSGEVGNRILDALRAVVAGVYGFLGLLALTVTFVVLGLIEVHGFRAKLEQSLRPETARKVLNAGDEVSTTLQRYMLARTIVSGTTGIFVGLFTWAIGLDFPLVWAVSSFLLNYIPMLGSIVAIVPPTIVAFLQPELWMGFAALGGLTLIQFTIGNYIDPQIEGKILSLSPFVLFFSIIFWGWVWSIPGALMGIPLTASIVIFCRKFENSRWIAQLLEQRSQ